MKWPRTKGGLLQCVDIGTAETMLRVRASSNLLPVILLIDEARVLSEYVPFLGKRFEVRTASTRDQAIAQARQQRPSVVVLELALGPDNAMDVCRAVKSVSTQSRILVTTVDVDLVPDALEAGCDSVLLKPFAPNLLSARLGRLVPDDHLSPAAITVLARSADLRQPCQLVDSGTNRYWPDTYCPHCEHKGTTSFDFRQPQEGVVRVSCVS